MMIKATTQGPGTQYVSWMHDQDYCRATSLILEYPEITAMTAGVVNTTAPHPLPSRNFTRTAAGVALAHRPAARTWMLEVGAIFLRTETELILKSRRVVPSVLLNHGFDFKFPSWSAAAHEIVAHCTLRR